MTRVEMKYRRNCITVEVKWSQGAGSHDHKLIIGYGCNDDWQIREAFVAGFRAEGTLMALANDSCILYSRCLQHGDTLMELAETMTENRPEGATEGPPASLLGAIARKAVKVQSEIDAEPNLRKDTT